MVAGRRKAIGLHRSQVADDIAPATLNEQMLEPLDWTDEYCVTSVEPHPGRPTPRAESLVRQGRGLEH